MLFTIGIDPYPFLLSLLSEDDGEDAEVVGEDGIMMGLFLCFLALDLLRISHLFLPWVDVSQVMDMRLDVKYVFPQQLRCPIRSRILRI